MAVLKEEPRGVDALHAPHLAVNAGDHPRKLHTRHATGWPRWLASLLRNQFDPQVATDCLRVPLKGSDGWRVLLASRFEPGDCALCGSHALGNAVLRKASPRTGLEHLVGKLVLQLQCAVRLGKALAPRSASQECLMIVNDRFELEVTDVATP